MTPWSRFWVVVLAGLAGEAIPVSSTQAATYTAQEQANIKLVTDFYAALDRIAAGQDPQEKIRDVAQQFLAESYTQHMEAARPFGGGRQGFIRMSEQMKRPAGAPPMAPAKILALTAEGDLVIQVSSREMPQADGKGVALTYIFNMFRVQDGKLAEHWDGSSGGGMGMGMKTSAPGAAARPH